jgi:hypothetical protein
MDHLTNEMDSPYLAGIAMCQSGVSTQPLNDRRSPHEYYNDWHRFGEDKFQPGGSNTHGKIVLRKTVIHGKLLSVIAQCPPCLIGLEACSGAHYWVRELEKLGHQVRIIAAKFIEPYRKGG